MICAICDLVVKPVKSANGIDNEFQEFNVGVNTNSCSLSSPPPNAASAPKSTNFTRKVVMFGVHTSMLNVSIVEALIKLAPVVSTPTKSSEEYFLTSLPATCTSVKTADDHEVLQVSTATFVYALLNREITLEGALVGVGAATVGSNKVDGLLQKILSKNTVEVPVGNAEKMICAMWFLEVRFTKSDNKTSYLFHCPNVGFKTISCSV